VPGLPDWVRFAKSGHAALTPELGSFRRSAIRALAWKLASFRKPRAKPVRLAKSLGTADEPAVLSAAKTQAMAFESPLGL